MRRRYFCIPSGIRRMRPNLYFRAAMQEIAKTYDPAATEEKWYAYWTEKGFFHAVPDERESYTVVIPPPNVTGVLHMGHILNNTIQDVLVRRARMLGYNACWVPGTDHASIATEAKVVAMLRERGIKKSDLSREEFLQYAWEWKEKYGGIILQQLKKMGASVDWERTHFTMDPDYYQAVIRVFVDLCRKGHIYRGLRMINWDCEARTAVSNEEVVYKEEGEKSFLYHVKYRVAGTGEWLVIATQRPETIMGDTAIAVNPTDERFSHLIGKKALVPMIGREVPIIGDDYVDKEFGTGCLKVTPAHDPNDYEIGLRHHLQVIDTINLDGTLNEKCEIPEYVGKDRFAVRDLVVKRLEDEGLLVKREEFITRIGRSERTNSVIEPKLSLQWFIRMKDISGKALTAVENDEIRLHPAKFKNTYRYWMENVRDWCISRQLWWGHRIPAWYYGEGENDFIVAETEAEALQMAREASGNAGLTMADLRQDEDVLDTWASSWLWPIEVFQGFADAHFDKETGKINKTSNADLACFYPTKVLVTAPEILFFWVARMIIAGYEYLDEKPFEHVYLTGIVRDKLGRKMSKSLGNSPDPIELMEKYTTDGVRTGMLFSSPAGNDLPFDESLCEQGRNFANKIWNAFRLVKGWEVSGDVAQPEAARLGTEWFRAKLDIAITEVNDLFDKFRISEALMALYKLTWDDFCSWYLEIVKPEFGKPIDRNTYNATVAYFSEVIRLLHPFMPFITEELWHGLEERGEKDSIMLSEWPEATGTAVADTRLFDESLELVTRMRNMRAAKGISPKEPLRIVTARTAEPRDGRYDAVAKKLANLSEIVEETDPVRTAVSFICGTREYFADITIYNVDEEIGKIAKELEYLKGFLLSVDKKLSNEKFVNSAPAAVVENERKKKADAEAKISAMEGQLDNLKNLVP